MIMPGLWDKKLKSGYRGVVVDVGGDKIKTVAVVYDDDLEKMRAKKQAVCRALHRLEATWTSTER